MSTNEWTRDDLDAWLYVLDDAYMAEVWLCERHAEMWNRLRFNGATVIPCEEPLTVRNGQYMDCGMCESEEAEP